MDTCRYLIVGGGLTADAACRGILEHDPEGSVMLIAGEYHPPYARPPLSKALWKGEEEKTICLLTANLGVHERLGRSIVGLDLDAHTATDDRGDSYAYGNAVERLEAEGIEKFAASFAELLTGLEAKEHALKTATGVRR